MPLNGSGGATQPTGSIYPAVASTLIESGKFNTSIADVYSILSSAIYKDGQSTTTQVIPFAQGIATDDIAELSSDAGVTIDSVLLKNGRIDTTQAGDVASATTTNLETATGNVVDVTGTTQIDAITLSQGHWRWVRFTGALQLTHGASLVLPGAQNITTIAGDYALFIGYASSVVRCAQYFRGDGTPLLPNIISPSQITANTDNYNPTGLSSANTLRLNSDARRNVTGIVAQGTGRTLTIHNVGTFPIVFTYEDTNSTAANRFSFGCTLGGGQSMEIQYDGTSSRWRGKVIPEPLGTVKDFGTSTMPAGFLSINQNVSRSTYASLFNEIGTSLGAGDGSTTFGLFLDGVLTAAGAFTVTEDVTDADITTGTDTIVVDSNNDKWVTGMECVWTVSGTQPTTNPANLLDNSDTVYIIRTGATSIKLATSLANAQNGTAIDITAAGSGTFTLTHTRTTRTLGERGGQDGHAMSSTENLSHGHTQNSHTHTMTYSGDTGAGALTGFTGTVDTSLAAVESNATSSPTSGTAATNQSTGGNAAMSIMQPFTAVTRGIRYA